MGALKRTPDVAVIGGGPAGCAAAIRLATAGADVVLFERERVTSPKVCGEFVSVEACDEARALGVDPSTLGAAAIDRVRVAWRGVSACARLPFRGASLSRAALDAALLECASAAGVRVVRGARAVAFDGDTLVIRDGEATRRVTSGAFVLATGKHEFAGFERSRDTRATSVGFKMHLDVGARDLATLGTTVELQLFDGGYAGMQRIEDEAVAFAVVVSRDAYARLGSWAALRESVARRPGIGALLARSRDRWPRPLAIANVPYGFRYRPSAAEPFRSRRVYRVGDQLAVIESFTGDGIAIALVTGSLAAAAIAGGRSADEFAASVQRRLDRPMRVAGALGATIRSAAGRAAIVLPARIAPGIFRAVAAQTRIPRTDIALTRVFCDPSIARSSA